MTTVPDVVKAYMLKRQMNSARLAREVGISPQAMHQFLNGKRSFSEKSLRRTCKILDIDFRKLWLLHSVLRGSEPKENFAEAIEHFERDLIGLLAAVRKQ
jgi:transcriptional regulator with XRE-family HTH domain